MQIDRRKLLALSGASALLPRAMRAAERYPARPIEMIVPNPAGGGYDQVARAVGYQLAKVLGKSVVTLNKPGASGLIGTAFVAGAKPDGYTLLFGGVGALAIAPNLHADLTYDPRQAFAPVMALAEGAYVLVVHPGVASSVQELIDKARANPGSLNYGSAGVGSDAHVTGEMFKAMTGTQINHIPYNGMPPILIDLVAGRIQMTFSPAVALPYIQYGKLTGLAVTTRARSPLMPGLPTIGESGVPGFDSGSWYGILAPAGTPRAVTDVLNQALNSVLQDDQFRSEMNDLGLAIIGGPPEALATRMDTELTKWKKVIADAHISPG